MNMRKTFTDLTIEDCYELFNEKSWIITFADGKFVGMKIEK